MLKLEEMKKNLIDMEDSVINISNKLQSYGVEDWCEFGNQEEILNSNSVILATDEQGENHIQVFFTVPYGIANTKEEDITATIIKITDIEEF